MKKFIIIAVLMLAAFSLMFMIAEQFGYADGQKIHALIQDFSSQPGSTLIISAIIVLLLMVDLFLPIPSSIVMASAGMFLGPWLGGTVAFIGAISTALVGYTACRLGGKKAFDRLLGDTETRRVREWFKQYGVVAVIISRPVPMLTEILSCLAGLSGLPLKTFILASVLGTLPICFIYSFVGSKGDLTNPWPALIIALIVPALGWIITVRIKKSF